MESKESGPVKRSGEKELKVFTDLNDIFQHNTKESVWLLIDNKVYDVTDFKHPGGKQILLQNAGQDATTQFEDIGHSKKAERQMEDLIVGTFDCGEQEDGGLDKKPLAEQETNPVLQAGLVLLFIAVVGFLYTQVSQ